MDGPERHAGAQVLRLLLSRRRRLLGLGLLLRRRRRLLLTLGRQVVPDGTAGCRAKDCVMTGHVAGDGTDGSAFDAAFCIGGG